jgi:DNA-binding FrmR family transcriptional regulator
MPDTPHPATDEVSHKEPTRAEEAYLDPQAKKSLADRLARLEGHVRAVRGMVLERRCADEILLQVAAVKAALNKFSAVLLEHELKVCLDSCMEGSAEERLDRVTKVLTTLLKQS